MDRAWLGVALVGALLYLGAGAAEAQEHWEADLTWDDTSDNELGFTVERQVAGGAWVVIATTGVNVEAHRDPGPLSENVVVCYRVSAFNADGASGTTTPACATPAVSEPPPPPPTTVGIGRGRIRY